MTETQNWKQRIEHQPLWFDCWVRRSKRRNKGLKRGQPLRYDILRSWTFV